MQTILISYIIPLKALLTYKDLTQQKENSCGPQKGSSVTDALRNCFS